MNILGNYQQTPFVCVEMAVAAAVGVMFTHPSRVGFLCEVCVPPRRRFGREQQ